MKNPIVKLKPTDVVLKQQTIVKSFSLSPLAVEKLLSYSKENKIQNESAIINSLINKFL